MYKTLTPPTFLISDTEDWKRYLDEQGFVVIRDLLSLKDQIKFWNFFREDLLFVSPYFKFNDPRSWIIKNYPGIFGKGMCVFNGMGQSYFSWFLRTHPNIKSIYSSIYDTDDLITSMDGFSLFVSNKQQSKSWNHIDQNPRNPIYSIQGSYNYYPVTPKDAGFVVAPKSHKEFNMNVEHKRNWIRLDKDSPWNEKVVKLCIPRNSFVLWNSRTIHANGGPDKKILINSINRLTNYITLLPRKYSSEENRQKRIQAYLDGNTCSHWANKCEIKRYPWGFKTRHEKKKLRTLKPLLIDNEIPADRLAMI